MQKTTRTFSKKYINVIAVAKMIGAISEESQSLATLIKLTGLHHQTIMRWLRELKKNNAVHIEYWAEDPFGRRSIRMWKLGAGDNAPRPLLTDQERRRRYRSKLKGRALLNAFKAIDVVEVEYV